MKRWGVVLAGLSLAMAAKAARHPVLQLSVDPPRAPNGEIVKLKLIVKYEGGASVRSPRMPMLSEWRVVNAYDSQAVSSQIVNGILSTRYTLEYTWLLKPLRTGSLKIPSMDLFVGTSQYRTEEVTVPVERLADGSQGVPLQAPSQTTPQDEEEDPDPWNGAIPRHNGPRLTPSQARGEAFFVRAEPSSTHVYQGELITLSYALYERNQSIANPEIAKFPTFKGFLKEELYVAKTFSRTPTQLEGKPYFRSELIRYALFPLKSGKITVEPFSFKADYLVNPMEDMMNNLMNGLMPTIPRGMNGVQPIPMRKSTASIHVEVRPLPPAPSDAHFTGGVGQFQMEVKGPPGELHVDQPFTVTLTVAGRGNIKTIEEPPLNLPKTLEPYQTKNNYEFREDASGYKTFEYLILPRAPGKVKLDPITWTYFDPAKDKYVTLASQSLEFSVEGATGAPAPTDAPGASTPRALTWAPLGTGPQEFVRVSDVGSSGLLASKFVWGFQGLMYAFAGIVMIRRRNESEEQAFFRKAPWEKTARTILSKSAWKRAELAILVDQWTRERLTGFIENSDIHSESSRDEFQEALRGKLHVEYHRYLDPLRKLWSELDIMRFTGTESGELADAKGLFEKAEKTIQAIVKAGSGTHSGDA